MLWMTCSCQFAELCDLIRVTEKVSVRIWTLRIRTPPVGCIGVLQGIYWCEFILTERATWFSRQLWMMAGNTEGCAETVGIPLPAILRILLGTLFNAA